MLRLAITGGLASGKSTVSALLRERGVPVVDADALGHELLQGEAGAEVAAAFGPAVTADGRISPPRLAALVFAPGQEDALVRLNGILHPRIMAAAAQRLEEYERQGREVAGVEAALLIEAGLLAGFDHVVLVTAPEEMRIARFLQRPGATREQAAARIRHQLPDGAKQAHADWVIHNDGSPAALAAQVEAMLHAWRKETHTP